MHTELVIKPEDKRTLGRHRRRWEDSIKTDRKETGREDVAWIRLDQDRFQWWAFCDCGNESLGSTKRFSGRSLLHELRCFV